jgi:hypothetical protein
MGRARFIARTIRSEKKYAPRLMATATAPSTQMRPGATAPPMSTMSAVSPPSRPMVFS